MTRFPASRLCVLVSWLASALPALAAGGRSLPVADAAPDGGDGAVADASARRSVLASGLVPLGGDTTCLIPQQPLPPEGRGRVFIFIGGMGDEVSGIMAHLYRLMPKALPKQEETRAYYHWTADLADTDPMAAARAIAADIGAYRQNNPGVDVVLMGHSLGASAALKTAALLPAGQGRVFLVTLDPVDRSTTPERPASVTWWGNAYVQGSRSERDFVYALGGRWNSCTGADLNLCFLGVDEDESGYPYIHDNAPSFLMSRRAATGSVRGGGASAPTPLRRPGYSLWDSLLRELKPAG